MGRQARRKHVANQQTTYYENKHYTQSKSLIKNLLLSAHTNNYLIKLIFPLYKTGLLPRSANFPVIIFPIIHVHDIVVRRDDLP